MLVGSGKEGNVKLGGESFSKECVACELDIGVYFFSM